MATGSIIGKVDIPGSLIKYSGINTDTADIFIDNYEYTFRVDVKKVPHGLFLKTNDISSTEVEFNGSSEKRVELAPITLNTTEYQE